MLFILSAAPIVLLLLWAYVPIAAKIINVLLLIWVAFSLIAGLVFKIIELFDGGGYCCPQEHEEKPSERHLTSSEKYHQQRAYFDEIDLATRGYYKVGKNMFGEDIYDHLGDNDQITYNRDMNMIVDYKPNMGDYFNEVDD